VIITCVYYDIRSGVFYCGGTANFIIKQLTIINTLNVDKRVINFESSGNFMIEDCIIKQDAGFILF
jgi:hypothetical protein